MTNYVCKGSNRRETPEDLEGAWLSGFYLITSLYLSIVQAFSLIVKLFEFIKLN